MRFSNRKTAGAELAASLKPLLEGDALILAMPGGARPLAYAVAQYLNLPLHPLPVRRLGIPGHDELSMGAIAPDVQLLDLDIIEKLWIGEFALRTALNREHRELQQSLRKHGHPSISGKTAVIIDEDIGNDINSMLAAIDFVRRQEPRQLLIAAPAASIEVAGRMLDQCDKLVIPHITDSSSGIEHWYDD